MGSEVARELNRRGLSLSVDDTAFIAPARTAAEAALNPKARPLGVAYALAAAGAIAAVIATGTILIAQRSRPSESALVVASITSAPRAEVAIGAARVAAPSPPSAAPARHTSAGSLALANRATHAVASFRPDDAAPAKDAEAAEETRPTSVDRSDPPRLDLGPTRLAMAQSAVRAPRRCEDGAPSEQMICHAAARQVADQRAGRDLPLALRANLARNALRDAQAARAAGPHGPPDLP